MNGNVTVLDQEAPVIQRQEVIEKNLPFGDDKKLVILNEGTSGVVYKPDISEQVGAPSSDTVSTLYDEMIANIQMDESAPSRSRNFGYSQNLDITKKNLLRGGDLPELTVPPIEQRNST